jgi:hypothetical protein
VIPYRAPSGGDGTQRLNQSQLRALPGGIRHNWYDWALVWRYWHGQAEGLRNPYPLERAVLLQMGRGLTDAALAERLGLSERAIARWRSGD